MAKITEGIVRFKSEVYPQKEELFNQLAKGQQPEALFVTCSDSRIDPNRLVQTDPGDLFVIRNAGNIVPPHQGAADGFAATIEYALAALGIKHIVVCGHSSCGAMQGLMNPESLTSLPHVSKWLEYSSAALETVKAKSPDLSEQDQLNRLIEENVLLQINHLKTHPQVAAKLAAGMVEFHAWVYDIGSGIVKAYDEDKGLFLPVEDIYQAEAKAFCEQQSGNCSH